MIPKISLAAAFLLMMAPPMACASNSRRFRNAAPITSGAHQSQPGVVLAQDGQPSMGTTNNDNDSDGDNDNDRQRQR